MEDQVGTPLFTRTRNNVQLTAQGERFVRHAETILNAWTRARHEVAVSGGSGRVLSIGGLASLWDILLQDWVLGVSARFPELSLTAEVVTNDTLVRRILDHTLDLAFSFESPQLSELRVVEIATVLLIMVTTHAGCDRQRAMENGDYALVDWGTGFAVAHAQAFPEMKPPSFRFGLGRLAHSSVGHGSLYTWKLESCEQKDSSPAPGQHPCGRPQVEETSRKEAKAQTKRSENNNRAT